MRNEWQPVTVTRESIASILTRNRLTVWHRVTVNNRVEYERGTHGNVSHPAPVYTGGTVNRLELHRSQA